MPLDRRGFVLTGAGSLLSLPIAKAAAADDQAAKTGSVRCLDYGLSFLCNTASFNAVRFWIESRTVVTDDKTGVSVEFYQCALCKSENTFAETNLFHAENYDFLPIFGPDDLLIFRRPVGVSERDRQLTKPEKVWGKPILKLREGKSVAVLDSWEKIRDVTAEGTPIVAQTRIANAETGLSAMIECPVKTMNVSLDKQLYQIDTGPIAYPDLTKRYQTLIECLQLAFIAFNAPSFADFVIEQPTPIMQDEKEIAVYHYSKRLSLPAKNTLLAVGSLAAG